MPLCREAVLGPAFTPGSLSGHPGPLRSARRLAAKGGETAADRRTQRIPPNGPVLKDGPNTASRRRPLKRPQREFVPWDLSRITWNATPRAGGTGRLLPLRVADSLKTLGATGRLAARVRCVEIPDGDDPHQTRVRRAGLKLVLRSARLNGSGATGQLAGRAVYVEVPEREDPHNASETRTALQRAGPLPRTDLLVLSSHAAGDQRRLA